MNPTDVSPVPSQSACSGNTAACADAASSARCPQCRAVFDCGMRTQPSACWCQSMPALPTERLAAGGSCLCPECLAGEIARAKAAGGASAPPGGKG
ncbi:cysteine-rich CWC family protein [Paraburkholderia sp.]|uniref:cysteine-rich CWC family protein n=1 Tax=Paraburkholderia sp. TaxID=1926495 RepID=UPI0023A3B0EE|nr:cysteine-rich CWC family protein [Paraburkholderia sp.]MDE1181427.1 cysteine-rich CWC family protein [Paraburkholderia sp.]